MCPIHSKKCILLSVFVLLIYLSCISIAPVAAIGEASKSLYAYVPPASPKEQTVGTGYYTATYIIVTATANDTVVDIIDLDTTIGDPTNKSPDNASLPVVNISDVDLSEYDVHLDKGQSKVIKVSYKAGGPDIDGAYFHVSSNKPVIVYTGTAQGQVQADFVPCTNGTMVGNSFFVYLPDCEDDWESGSGGEGKYVYDLAVFAFEDDTNVSVYNISTTQTLVEMNNISQLNATTSINFSSAKLIANKTLYPNTPNKILNHAPTLYLQAFNGSGIERGYTYYITANKSISVASVGLLNNNETRRPRARDGAYYVPGISDNPYHFGTGLAHTFYMQLNDHLENKPDNYENEIYLINQNTTNTANVTIEEFNTTTWQWDKIPGENRNTTHPDGRFTVLSSNITEVFSANTTPIQKWDNITRYNHHGLMRVSSKDSSGKPMDISVFAGVGLMTTNKTFTADIAAFTSGDTGYGGAKETILYVPPPSKQPFFNDSIYSHVYIYIHNNNTNVTIQGWNLSNNNWQTVYLGEYTNISKYQIIDYRVNKNQWQNGTDKNGSSGWDFNRLRVLSTQRTTVQVNNWDDNWASYVPGGTPPTFTTDMSVQSRYLTVNSIPIPRVRYSFDISNEAINNIGSNLKNLSVTNTIPDGIDQREIFWSIDSNIAGFEYNSSSFTGNFSQSPIDNGTKYIWKNTTLEVTAFAYNDGSGTVFVFNRTDLGKNEILHFFVDTPLNSTYYDGTPIQAGSLVINVSAQAENPFLGKVSAYVKLPGTIVLHYISPGVIYLY
jgi:hypothetical protein